MAEPSRYNITQKGAKLVNGILKNNLKILEQEELDKAESVLLADTYGYFLNLNEKNKLTFNLKLIFEIHHYFLGTLYEWAGRIRSVDISKNGFLFCSATHIKINLERFEDILKGKLPKKEDNPKTIAQKLAIIHNEFNVIHPFRDGNGHTIRLFLDLALGKIGYEWLDYGNIDLDEYFSACKAGFLLNHEPMADIFYKDLKSK